ncbi:1-aminocyclopropane-1-carboxylate deaminase/D-cysteine desulfhydrase [Maribacter sp. ANRC-HE7]|uniref:1-aminocyclopropane-1-carboxylate deaminase/D-cysteine desulfhydrase n=1 Tax=Maribacter aquimaris TaxID=2737171 RepID=A0ABR7UXN7_9FLAO|nr:pyridoxal-phosphate dependent enzyme [Maribacter aquimaris]MBD0777345.1 1-aminocyclopropane-1-carboxylate deaminase/D-cysteine desulfhydrase [Maribacter aquimaris]
MQTENQKINLPILESKRISLFIKREDRIHPFISGNKYRKLKYNTRKAISEKFDTLLTFGGAYSNHIAATACAAQENGLQSVGVIRGEELAFKWRDNPTLATAAEMGMQLKFVPRSIYKNKHTSEFSAYLKSEYNDFYLLPEGGTNDLAVKGCEEILTEGDKDFDIICSSVGTGGTIAGIINATEPEQKVFGFPALKGDFLKEDIRKFVNKDNWALQTDYHFGGYAKVSVELIDFINDFKRSTQVPLDPVYTAKMLFGIMDMVNKDSFEPGTKILAIHTGGLQGITGMNSKLKKKNSPLINL